MSTATITRSTTGLSDKQINYMNTMLAKKDHGLTDEVVAASVEAATADWKVGRRFIDFLVAAPWKPTPPAVDAATEPGMYRVDGDLFKVQASKASGNLYAKKLSVVAVEDPKTGGYVKKGEFAYAPGAMRKITSGHRITIAEAIEFGGAEGVCCQCGRTLRAEKSVTAGIGPVCSSKI